MSNAPRSSIFGNVTSHPYFLVIILTLATFMEVVDLSILAVSLPKMSGDLGAGPNEIVLVLTSYLVANAAVIPLSGWLATYFGRKRYYLACVAGFTISSFLCGIAPNLELLILFRILQGISGGGLAPSEQAILADVTPPGKLGRVFSIYGSGLMIASVIAPTLGGFITDSFGWRWVFFINIPVGVSAFFLSSFFVYDPDEEIAKDAHEATEKAGKIDWLGILLIIVGVSSLLIVLESGPQESWFDSNWIFILTIISAISLLFAVAWELVFDQPVLDLELLKSRGFAVACIIIFFASFIFSSGIGFLIAFFTQNVLDYSAMQTGLVHLPGAITVAIGIHVVGYVIDKFEAKYVIAIGYFLSAAAILHFANLTAYIPFSTLVMYRTLISIPFAFGAVGVNTTAFYGIDPKKHNNASSILNFSRIMGVSFGYSVVSTLFVIYTQRNFVNLSTNYSELNPNYVEAQKTITNSLMVNGVSAKQAAALADSSLIGRLIREAYTLATVELLWIFAGSMLLLFLLSFLLNKKPSDSQGSGH